MDLDQKNSKKPNRTNCCVPQCNNYFGNGITMHLFPKNNEVLRRRWTELLKIGKRVSNYMRVCSEHFSRSDYFFPDVTTKTRRLKKNSEPSQNLPKGSITTRKGNSPQKRARLARALARQTKTSSNSCHLHKIDQNHNTLDTVITEEDDNRDKMDAATALLQLSEAINEETAKPASRETNDFGVQVTPSILNVDKFTVSNVLRNDAQLRAFTGLATRDRFEKLVKAVEKLESLEKKGSGIRCSDRLMLTLIKLKLNLSYVCLSALFDVNPTTCQRYFADMIRRLGKIMKKIIRFPPTSEIKKNLPTCFKKYSSTRIILDCTEVKIEKNKCLKCRISTYSHYKGCQTMKVLIGNAPSGLITYVSNCFGGRSSDKGIFLKSGLLEVIERGESIMVDKGFLIEKECLERGIQLIRPPFKRERQQMSAADALATASIAAARVHVERSIQRLKIFKILKTDLSYNLLPFCNDIMVTIAGLTNLSSPILASDKFL